MSRPWYSRMQLSPSLLVDQAHLHFNDMTPPTTGIMAAAEHMSRSGSDGSHGSAEVPKQKRKGTRSVASLTPQQLARKRANDREAQRAIRQRTKEHIERLEKEVAALKASQKHGVYAALVERNRQLEAELARLRAASGYGYQSTAANFHTSPFDESTLTGASPRSSPYPGTPFDGMVEDLTPTAPFIGMDSTPMYVAHSNASSPASSSNQDEFAPYMTPALGPSMAMGAITQQGGQVQYRGDFDEGDTETMYSGVSQQHYRHPPPAQPPTKQQQSANWSYHNQSYYGSSNSPLHTTA